MLLAKSNNNTLNNYYTQTEINASFSIYYSEAYIDIEFDEYYLKTYIDTTVGYLIAHINLKLNSASITNYDNKSETDTLFSDVIDTAPEAMNTLKELADALGNDSNLSATVENQIALKRNISDNYNKTEVTNIFSSDTTIVKNWDIRIQWCTKHRYCYGTYKRR